MKVNAARLENHKALLEIEVDANSVGEAIEQAYRRIVKKVTIPGFRKGKAPRAIVERFAGKAALYEEALDILVPRAYQDALEEAGYDPISRPDIELVNFEEGKPLSFKATVEIKPEVQLGEYVDPNLKYEVPEVKSEAVDFQIERLRDSHAQLVVVEEGEVANGLYALIDFEGFIDDQPFPGGKAEGYLLEVGSGRFIPGFEEGLVGARAGEDREVKVTFPQDYPAQDLAGKEATFKVRVREIKRKELPELNDEFARSVGSYASLQELRDTVENRLKEISAVQARRDFENKVIDSLVDRSQVEVPESLVNRRIDRMVHDLEHRLEAQKVSLDDYLKDSGKSLDDVRNEFRPAAERGVKADLVLEAVAKKEKISAEAAEINAEIDRFSRRYNQPVEVTRKFLMTPENLTRIEDGIIADKTARFLADLNVKAAGGPEV